jgi:FkbM family methyltransferase
MIKKILKTSYIYSVFFYLRKQARVLYSTKSRSRFFWNLRNGDEVLSLDYPLKKSSVAFVVGAYKGDYLNKLDNKFNCQIYAFEPISEYYEILNSKFEKKENINLYNIGLSDSSGEEYFQKIGESSSVYGESTDVEKVELMSIDKFMSNQNLKNIDFIYMNIEGGEYNLIKKIIASNLIKNINFLQVQFHNINKDSVRLRKEIRSALRDTHRCIFNFPFIWERWDLK